MNEARGGALVEGITFIISSQTIIVQGVRRFPACYVAVAFEKLDSYLTGNISLGAPYISG